MHEPALRAVASLPLFLALGPLAAAQGPPGHLAQGAPDWLVDGGDWTAVVREDAGAIVLENGLVRRTIAVEPNGATIALDDLMTGRSLLRAVGPEAELVLDGEPLAVGGLVGQPDHAFLLEAWRTELESDPAALQLAGWEVGRVEAPFAWKRVRPGSDAPGRPLVFECHCTSRRQARDVE